MSMPLVFIDGNQDTTGLQIHEHLCGRVEQQDLKLLTPPVGARKDAQRRVKAIDIYNIAILCLSDAVAHEAVAATVNPCVHVIDASFAHRTMSGQVYGFPEMSDEQAQRIAGASCVVNPGCYPIGAIGLLRPLVQAGLAPADYPINIYAVSDYSSGGRVVVEAHEGPEAASALPLQMYRPGPTHKYAPEIQLHTGLTQRPTFVPAHGAYRRDIVLTMPLGLRRPNAGVDVTVLHTYPADHYVDALHMGVTSLQVPSALPHLDPQTLNDTNDMRLSVFANNYGQVLFTAVFDNLDKGVSDAAVQNLDLMLTQQWQIEWKAS